MISCKEASRLNSLRLDGQLPWRRRPALWFHMFLCGWCRCCGRKMMWLRRAAGAYPEAAAQDPAPSMPDAARERIRRACCDEDHSHADGER